MSSSFKLSVAAFALGTVCASAQFMAPLSSFGGGDGWLAPGEGGYTFLGTANNERGMTYYNGNVYLVSRTGGNNVRILNGTTGADIGSLNTAGIAGGTFAISTIAASSDGTIYAANLTTQSTTTPYKVYSWSAASPSAAPTLVYSGNGGLPGSRIGDSIAIIGSGASTLIAAGYGNSPAVAGNNGVSLVNPTTGTASAISFIGTPPNAGDFRLGLTFIDSSHLLGTAGSSLYRDTSYSGTSGTLLASPAIPDAAGATADRLLAYTTLGGTALLAVQSIGDSHVSIYNVNDPSNPLYLAGGDNASGSLTANANGTGEIAWGAITSNPDGSLTEALYAMSSNQGIQAFLITVPEPASISLIALGAAAVMFRKKLRR